MIFLPHTYQKAVLHLFPASFVEKSDIKNDGQQTGVAILDLWTIGGFPPIGF